MVDAAEKSPVGLKQPHGLSSRLHWLGDNYSDWASLRNTMQLVLNMGLSGIAFTGPDTGGFAGTPDGELHRLSGVGPLGHLGLVQVLVTRFDELVDLVAERLQIDVQVPQHQRRNAGTHRQDPQQDVHRGQVVMMESYGFLIGQGQGPSRAVAESFVHGGIPFSICCHV